MSVALVQVVAPSCRTGERAPLPSGLNILRRPGALLGVGLRGLGSASLSRFVLLCARSLLVSTSSRSSLSPSFPVLPAFPSQ
eukprot:122128-Chlamydomonas_euryale.AAC.1